MGYSTNFTGKLTFAKEPTASQLAKLKSFLGADCREHKEWHTPDLTYIDLKLTDDFSGLEWDGSEKTYDLERKVNVIIEQMQKTYPDFALEGQLSAQGEDADDRWWLKIKDGWAIKEDIPLSSDEIKCPHCGDIFKLQDAAIKNKRR